MAVNPLKHFPLNDLTTYRIGGPARHYVLLEDPAVLPDIIREVRERQEPYFVLGGGSNVLISDKGFEGTVIHMRNQGIDVDDERMIVGAGEPLANVVAASIENGLGGLEWATSIPGSIGGATLGNAGAFYGTMADVVRKVTVFDPSRSVFQTYTRPECQFRYRSSVFKHSGDIITSIELKFRPTDKRELKRKSEHIRHYRASRHPTEPSVGSVFKNIDDKSFIIPFLEEHSDAREQYTRRWKTKIPSAYLIDLCGLKGLRVGGAQVAHKHSAFIINTGAAKADDIVIMAGIIKERVWNRFGIHMREEMRYIGF